MRHVLLVLGFLGPLLAASEGAAQATVQKHIKIVKPWVHETREWRALLSVTIANIGDRADRLVRVATRIAKRVEISDQEGREGGGLTIPGSAEFVIGRGAPRIELVGLKRSLNAHERFHLLLVFAQAGKVRVDVLVEKGPARSPPAAADGLRPQDSGARSIRTGSRNHTFLALGKGR
jgi:copper(I)-binding protein